MATRLRIDDTERRARLVARHHLGRTAGHVVEAVRGVLALHSSDPLTPYLGCRARVDGFAATDLDRALYEERSLWRVHAMRRTLFVVAAEQVPVLDAAVGRDLAARERRRVEQWLAAEMPAGHVPAWLADVETKVREALTDGAQWRTQELSEAVPELRTELTVGSGKWATRSPLSSRLLFLLAMECRVVRARPAGTWRSSQYHWAAADPWRGEPAARLEPEEGRAELLRSYLAAHGPATAADVRWWTGWPAKHLSPALEQVGAVAVDLDCGAEGFVLPDDLESTDDRATVVALLPALDSTPMGWKERGWYTGAHSDPLFDRNGNVGPTIWADGRIVGGWAQRPGGEVVWRVLADVGADTSRRIAEEAAALTEWMDGIVATPRFRTPLERELSG